MKPYWSDESIALYHGDWRDHLREIAALEADLIVTDPPYGETAARATGRRAVCFEVRESQCEAAAKRLDAGMLDFTEGC